MKNISSWLVKAMNMRSIIGSKYVKLFRILVGLFFLICFFLSNSYSYAGAVEASYDFDFIPHQWLIMPDGVKLSVSYWKPKAKVNNERFPVVIEVLPYRKDDNRFVTDYPAYAYLARHGIAGARIDIRGTGSSEGAVPDREYSDQELADIMVSIEKVAKLPWSNGNIGMQGISWSAFNAMMIAMRQPPHLKGILIAHGSEDIYANDIHNIDGALHLDIFSVEIEADNLLPRTPDYKLDQSYFADRFNQKPWIFAYLRHQRDGKFWQSERSLQSDYSKITIPVYAFSSLLDGYKDFATNMLENVRAPIKVSVGPQSHSWPNDFPGPSYEWRQMAVRWWQQVLNDKETGIWKEPNFMFFMRDPVSPNLDLQETPGAYWSMQGPIHNKNWQLYFLQKNGELAISQGEESINSLRYQPDVGKGILNWWGEATPDMRPADEGVLLYDSPPITKDFEIMGNPEVTLKVAASAPLAHWIVRLEDVAPDGKVAFVTGGLKNGAHRNSRIEPSAIPIGKFFDISFPLHFTTWKFVKGHKIRFTVANAQFPMIWPTPYSMTTSIAVGSNASILKLPLVPNNKQLSTKLPPLEEYELPEGVLNSKSIDMAPFVITQDNKGNVFATSKEGYYSEIHGIDYKTNYKVTYRVNNLNPADASFIGEGEDLIGIKNENRYIKIRAKIIVDSDEKYFHVAVTRKVFENGVLRKTKAWKEDILRDYE